MMEIQIKLLNAKELAAAFKKAPGLATQEYALALERTARKIEGDAKRAAPVNKQSGGGNLRQLISSRMQGSARAVVESKAKYSAYVDQGTRPHVISVVNKKVLANKRMGQVFGRRVKHPGTRANPFFTNSVKGNEGYFNDQMKNALQNVLNQIK
jgi:HK97 gp10 family phage protein